MNCEKVFAKIDELNDKFLNILEDLCNIESPTDNKDGVDKASSLICDFAEKRDWHIEKKHMEKSGDVVCITMNNTAQKDPVALSGHLDTVHPLGLFGTPAVHRDETKMYGPGTADCKGGVISALLAMTALEETGFTSRPIKLILQTDEEVSSMYSNKKTIDFMCEKAKNAVAFLNCEEGGSKVTLTRKGILRVDFHVTGIAGHSSVCFNAANAITEAAHKIIRLEQMKDSHGLTCNCGVISGGTVANTVAEHCDFVADIRFNSDEELQTARNIIKEVSENTIIAGCKCEVVERSFRPEMPASEANNRLFDFVNKTFSRNGLDIVGAKHGHGGSDAAYTTKAGIPTLDSFGVFGGGVHSKDEYMLLSSLALSAKRIACVVAEI